MYREIFLTPIAAKIYNSHNRAPPKPYCSTSRSFAAQEPKRFQKKAFHDFIDPISTMYHRRDAKTHQGADTMLCGLPEGVRLNKQTSCFRHPPSLRHTRTNCGSEATVITPQQGYSKVTPLLPSFLSLSSTMFYVAVP